MYLTKETLKDYIDKQYSNSIVNYWSVLNFYAICGEDLKEFETSIIAEQIISEKTQEDVIETFYKEVKDAGLLTNRKDIDVDVKITFTAESYKDLMDMQNDAEQDVDINYI